MRLGQRDLRLGTDDQHEHSVRSSGRKLGDLRGALNWRALRTRSANLRFYGPWNRCRPQSSRLAALDRS